MSAAVGARAVPAAEPAPAQAPESGLWPTIDRLLRQPDRIDEQIRDGVDLATVARASILTIAAGAAIFGAAVGAYRGGVQVAYAAIKFPLVLIATAAVCAPTLTALGAALGRSRGAPRDLAVVLAALATTSVVLATGAPLLVLAGLDWVGGPLIGYHGAALVLFAVCAVAGLLGLRRFRSGLRKTGGAARGIVPVVAIAVFAVVGAQMSWTFRPYLVRPKSQEVVFIRAIEGSLFDSVRQSTRSARGDYDAAASSEFAPDGTAPVVDTESEAW